MFIVSHINTANTIQCSFFGGPTWYTMSQHQANIGSMSPAYTRRQKQAYCHFFSHAAAAPADVFVITAGGRRNTVRSATCPQQTRNVDPMLGWCWASVIDAVSALMQHQPFQCGDRLYTPESDVCRRQILTYKVDPRTENEMNRALGHLCAHIG